MKIIQRQLNGYLIAKREWISQNDDYNIQHFGITKDTYNKISKVCSDLYGTSGDRLILADINRRLVNEN